MTQSARPYLSANKPLTPSSLTVQEAKPNAMERLERIRFFEL